MAKLQGPNWLDLLPGVLLGIRTAPKEDLQCSSAELVYGFPLSVPGDFIPTKTSSTKQDPSTILPALRDKVRNLVPISMTRHILAKPFVPESLTTAKYVFVRAGATRRPLVPPYEGPFKVLQRNQKTFLLDIGGEEQTVSLDRLKPAFLDHSTSIPTPKPKKRGRPPITREKT